ncbi:MBL fold metallo-hydrolase [Nocardia asteroides]
MWRPDASIPTPPLRSEHDVGSSPAVFRSRYHPGVAVIFNCEVIHTDSGHVVVDRELPSVLGDLAPLLARTGEPVSAIVATNRHSDHFGGAPSLAERWSAPTHLSTRTYPVLPARRTPANADVARHGAYLAGADRPARDRRTNRRITACGLRGARGDAVARHGTGR